MSKRLLIGAVVALAISSTLSASEFNLKENMYKLNNHLMMMQAGFIEGDKEKSFKAAQALSDESQKLLGNEEVMRKMLPPDKAYKAHIATTSAHLIVDNVEIIKSSKDNFRRETAQNAYLDIQRACMRCHNLVRDW